MCVFLFVLVPIIVNEMTDGFTNLDNNDDNVDDNISMSLQGVLLLFTMVSAYQVHWRHPVSHIISHTPCTYHILGHPVHIMVGQFT